MIWKLSILLAKKDKQRADVQESRVISDMCRKVQESGGQWTFKLEVSTIPHK
jgi:hypothetical protein